MKNETDRRSGNGIGKRIAATIGAVLLLVTGIFGAWGSLDPSFGNLGTAFDDVPDHAPGHVAIQSDGRILVAGWRKYANGGYGIFLRRYLPDGGIDSSFGSQGAANIPGTVGSATRNFVDSLTVLPGGKIIVYGRADDVFALWQITPTGQSDTGFGENGFLLLLRYPAVSAYPAIVRSQFGKLIVGVVKVSTNEVFLLRLNSDGSTDGSFGTFGTASTNVKPNGYGMLVDPLTGVITLSGWINGVGSAVGLDRKLANGRPDPAFNPTTNPVQGGPFGLFKTTSGDFVIPSFNGGSDRPNTLNHFSAGGAYKSMWTIYGNQGHCPRLVATQSDGKTIFGNLGQLNRLRTSSTLFGFDSTDCAVITYLTYRATPALQSDNKLVFAGVMNDRLALVRVLPY